MLVDPEVTIIALKNFRKKGPQGGKFLTLPLILCYPSSLRKMQAWVKGGMGLELIYVIGLKIGEIKRKIKYKEKRLLWFRTTGSSPKEIYNSVT